MWQVHSLCLKIRRVQWLKPRSGSVRKEQGARWQYPSIMLPKDKNVTSPLLPRGLPCSSPPSPSTSHKCGYLQGALANFPQPSQHPDSMACEACSHLFSRVTTVLSQSKKHLTNHIMPRKAKKQRHRNDGPFCMPKNRWPGPAKSSLPPTLLAGPVR